MKILIVVDMQNDFITGPAINSPEIQRIVPAVAEKINSWTDQIIVTRDTHNEDYLNTQEGRFFPVVHGLKGTDGWKVETTVQAALDAKGDVVSYLDKYSFGCLALGDMLIAMNKDVPIEEVQFVGICTDVCVLSNVLIAKAALPEVPVVVDASCCAGVTPEGHRTALAAMGPCQALVINDN